MNLKWKATEEDNRVYSASREAFNNYAALDGNPREAHLPELSCVQIDLMRWARHHFGLQPATYMALGICEEAGELQDADTFDETEDAIGDIFVYCAQLCTTMRLDLGVLALDLNDGYDFHEAETWGINQLGIATGRVAHVVLKTEQKIRGYAEVDVSRFATTQALMRVVACTKYIATLAGIDARQTFIKVSNHVMKRDWKADAKTAGGHA